MEIYCGLFNAKIDLDGEVNVQKNMILTHKSLKDYISRLEDVSINYDYIRTDCEHSIVACRMSSVQYRRSVIEIGETQSEFLPDNFKKIPFMTAFSMAFDRAAIRFLKLPTNAYSFLEFYRNAEPPTLSFGNVDDPNLVLQFGIYTNMRVTVHNAFEWAKKDETAKANLKLYLAANPYEKKDAKERDGLLALQRYAQKINWKG